MNVAANLEEFRDTLRFMVANSDLPECVDRRDYRMELPAMWSHNPARAFLRLTDADQRKVLEFFRGLGR